ncbi:hypothetical protein PPERSA_12943 [Pseudocohnilembus persalinus]|uniref:Ion transport domain-containing protein n=1 Tax=Pseudocohnilembus persalinus TaxID=266149 RepID=A0A0V0R1T5_PSEPJ|nr:hypothetical protein PPERSA_12943 [Pseudocohnilembus persalinus]|eukprot:KRX08462.1 hypothetical protein PPERSA_12943 [Pseudocohnilembus persalinus]
MIDQKKKQEEDNNHDSEEERDKVPNDLQQQQQQIEKEKLQRPEVKRMSLARRSQIDLNLAKLQRAILQQTKKDKQEKEKKVKLAKNFFVHGKQLRDYKFRLDPEFQEKNWRNEMIDVSEIIFSIIFLLEFIIKSIGMGFFFGQGTYLKDGWNMLDFVVVCSSIISFFPDTVNLSAVRTLRILRPLRSINSVKGMKVLVTTLIDSLPALGNVVIFLFFVMVLFAILSLQLFSGVFENRCRMTEFPVDGKWEVDNSYLRLCNINDQDSCPKDRWCGSPYDYGLTFNQDELQYEEFNYGYTKFDNLFQALFSIFQSLTTEGWTNIVFLLTNTYTPIIVYLYFIFLCLVGSFFVVNLILAVVNESFVNNKDKTLEKQDNKKEQEEIKEIKNEKESDLKESLSVQQQDDIIEQQQKENESKQIKRRIDKDLQNYLNFKNSLDSSAKTHRSQKLQQKQKMDEYSNPLKKENSSPSVDTKNQSINLLISCQSEIQLQKIVHLTQMDSEMQGQFTIQENINEEHLESGITPQSSNRQKRQKKNLVQKLQASQFSNSSRLQQSSTFQQENLNKQQIKEKNQQKQQGDEQNENNPEKAAEQEQEQEQEITDNIENVVSSKVYKQSQKDVEENSSQQNTQSQKSFDQKNSCLQKFRKKVAIFIDDPFFLFLTTLLIIANTITLALDKYPTNSGYSNRLETANLIFTYCFVVEMVIKMFGLGIKGYLRDSFNIFDGTIVMLSLIEIVLSQSEATDVSGGGFAAISAFRSLRLFRIFKLARSWVSLRQLLMAMGQTLAQISNFSVLVLLFMVVASLLGIEFFAYKIRFEEDGSVAEVLQQGKSPRVNYDTFLHGIVATFVLLTNEDWNAVLYDHMRGIGNWIPSIYFIIVVVIGNFILLQLFLAILIYNFEEAQQDTKEKINQENRAKRLQFANKQNSNSFSKIKNKLKNLFRIKNNKDEKINSNNNINNSNIIHVNSIRSPSNSHIEKKCYSNYNSSQIIQPNQEEQIQENYEQNGIQTTVGQTIQSRNNSNAQPINKKQNQDLNNYLPQKQLVNSPSYSPKSIVIRQNSAQDNYPSQSHSNVNSPYNQNQNQNQKTSKNYFKQRQQQMAYILDKKINQKSIQNPLRKEKADTVNFTTASKNYSQNETNFTSEYPSIPGLSNQLSYGQLDQQQQLQQQQHQQQLQQQQQQQQLQYNIYAEKTSSMFISEQFEMRNREQKQFLFQNQEFRSQLIGSPKSELLENNCSSGNIAFQNPKQLGDRYPLVGNSLFCLGQKNQFRQLMYYICGQNWFEWAVIGLILFSSIILVLDDPFKDPKSSFKKILNYADMVITLLFVLESLIKIIAYGFLFNGKYSYLRSISNCLDFLIVIFSTIGVFYASDNGLEKVKVLRILRVLRPLRLISKNEGLKLAINSLILSIPQIIDEVKQEDIITKQDCFDYGGDWVNQAFNFDNLLNGMVTLFVLSTTEGWVSMMWNGVDAQGIDINPQRDSNQIWAIFYILFILVGGFFVMNLFAGIVVESFNTEKNKLAGMTQLHDSQQQWIEIGNRIIEVQPQKQISKESLQNSSWFRTFLFKIVTNRFFDPFILLCIIINTIVFMLVYHRQNDELADIISAINIVFLVIFTLECVIKIIAFKSYYFFDSWNIFDFVVVILTLIGVILEYLQVIQNIGSATSIIRTFRIARVLKLIKRAKSLRMMFATFILTLPALANIGALLFLVLFLYSVLGMNLFGYVKPTDDGITDKANFSGFFRSFFILFKCSTGESWNLVLRDIVQDQAPNNACVNISSYEDYQEHGLNGCGSSVGYLYFITFQIIFSMIVLNLFVAVILEGFDKITKDEESTLKPYQVQQFVEEWLRLDPSGSGFIPCKYFKQFMEHIEMGFKGNEDINSQFEKNIKIAHLHLQIYVPKPPQPHIPSYNFQETLIALAKAQLVEFYIKKGKQKNYNGENNLDPEQININLFRNNTEKPILALTKLDKKIANNYKKIKNYLPIDYTSSDYIGFEYINRQLKLFQARKQELNSEQLKQNSQEILIQQNDQKPLKVQQQIQESEIKIQNENQKDTQNQQLQLKKQTQQIEEKNEDDKQMTKVQQNIELKKVIAINTNMNNQSKPYLPTKFDKLQNQKKRSISNNNSDSASVTNASSKSKKFDLGNRIEMNSKQTSENSSKNNLLNNSFNKNSKINDRFFSQVNKNPIIKNIPQNGNKNQKEKSKKNNNNKQNKK